MDDSSKSLPGSIRLARILAFGGLILFAVSSLFLQALLFTTRGPLPEISRDNQVRTFAVYLPRPSAAPGQGSEPAPGLQLRGVETIRSSLEKAIAAQQVRIVDSFAGFSEQTLSREQSSVTTQLTGVAGNFTAFRQMEILSGAFLAEGDWNRQTIVLDEIMAWQLFGAIDIAGMTLKIQGRTFTVAGVVRLPVSWQDQISRQDEPQAFIRFDTLASLDARTSVTAYEVRLPEPVEGMGLSHFRDAVAAGGLNFDNLILVEHDRRLSLPALLSSWGEIGYRAKLDSTIILPWWENTSRAAVDLGGILIVLSVTGLAMLIAGLYSFLHHRPADRKNLSVHLLLSAAMGIGLAFSLINMRGQLMPAGWPWLMQLLAIFALPHALVLLMKLAASIHLFAPDWATLYRRLSIGLYTILLFIKRLRDRLSAKKETPL